MKQLVCGSILLMSFFAFGEGPANNFHAVGTQDGAPAEMRAENAVLFSNLGDVAVGATTVTSQHFTNDPDSYTTTGAEDFTVTGDGWTITHVAVYGDYDPDSPAGFVNDMTVTIYENDGGLPGAEVTSFSGLTPNDQDFGDFRLTLPSGGYTLTPGTYWISVVANYSGANGQWLWTTVSPSGNNSAWTQSTPNYTPAATCVDQTWGERVATCGIGSAGEEDFSLRLEGTQLTAGVTVSKANMTLTEDGSAETYTVVLTAPPANGETVTVTPSSNDVTEATVSGALNFTAANWDTPQTVTVTPGNSGDGNDGDVTFDVDNTVSGNASSGYDAVAAASVSEPRKISTVFLPFSSTPLQYLLGKAARLPST